MLVEKAFKLFTENTLKEPINKNKKNYDYCIDTYAKAQLIDITSVYYSAGACDNSTAKVYENMNEYIVRADLPDVCKELTLPFEVCFFKLYDNNRLGNDKSAYFFIKDYAPMTYTGALMIELSDGSIFKIIFIVSENKVEYVLKKDILLRVNIEDVLKSFAGKIIRTLTVINKLSPKVHNIYKVAPEHTEYLRKKLTRETIKVRRPIYIYINQKEKENTINPTKQYNAERVTRELSWIVRGHWRRLDSPSKRGKNANGEYVVEGYTWVVPHVCGNKDILPERRLYITTGD